MERANDIKIEQAKSFFTLAQLLMILGGFFLASSSIFFTNAQNSLEVSAESIHRSEESFNFMLENLQKIQELNLTENYNELILSKINISESLNKLSDTNLDSGSLFFYFGLGMVFFSIVSFMVGKFKLSKIK